MMQFTDDAVLELMIAQALHDCLEDHIVSRSQAASLAYRLAKALQINDPNLFAELVVGKLPWVASP